MTRPFRPIARAVLLAGAVAAAACGKKAPPLAPLVIRPAAPEDVKVVRVADTVHISFKVPDKNTDGKSPARLARVEVYGLTGDARDVDGNGLNAASLLREATKVGELEVEPPPPPASRDEARTPAPDPSAPPAPPPPPTPEDPRPAQGEVVTISEVVTPAVLARYVPPGKPKRKPLVRRPQPWDDLPLPLATVYPDPLARIYIAVGRDAKGRPGAVSGRVAVPLERTPPVPAAPMLTHTETTIVATWVVPPGALRPVFEEPVPVPVGEAPPAVIDPAAAQATSPQPPATSPTPVAPAAAAPATPATPPAEAAPQAPPADPVAAVPVPTVTVMPRPLVQGPAPHTFNLYAVAGTSTPPAAPSGPPVPAGTAGAPVLATPATALVPLNPAPLSTLVFEDSTMAFGVERCYVLRAVDARPNGRVEGPSSPVACITPVDTFPPKAPRSLAAVGSEGAVNLIWEPNTEGDLAGYIVLRGPAGGGALSAITPTPIKETTYRDAQVTRGQRYVYAIVAVDTAAPQNVSVESNRVEETAR